MLFPSLETKLRRAAQAFDAATTDNIVELCRQYLALLADYRAQLYKLPRTPGVNQWTGSFLWEDVANFRKAVRAAIEETTRERNSTEALLNSFISVSGYGAVEMSSQEEGEAAIAQFNGKDLQGRNLTVNVAKPRESHNGGRGN